jgi:hypothetical protein
MQQERNARRHRLPKCGGTCALQGSRPANARDAEPVAWIADRYREPGSDRREPACCRRERGRDKRALSQRVALDRIEPLFLVARELDIEMHADLLAGEKRQRLVERHALCRQLVE